MKKEAEIKLLEEIKANLLKLLSAKDGYIKEFIGKYLDNTSIDLIINNIRNDFPPLLHTPIEHYIIRATALYKEKAHNYQLMLNKSSAAAEERRIMLKTVQLSYNVLGKLTTAHLELFVLLDNQTIEPVEYLHRVYTIYNINDIIKVKMNLNIALNKKESIHIKQLINKQTNLLEDENTKQQQ